jgi:hypothetical protein
MLRGSAAARRVVRFAPEEALPPRESVLSAQGLPAEGSLTPRLRQLLLEARASYLALAAPRAVWQEVSPRTMDSLLASSGAAPDGTVVGRVFPRATAMALFVATVGEHLPARIGRLFDEGALAEAWMLDAVASAATDLLADTLAGRFAAALAERGEGDLAVLPYSPGYCGWPTQGQRSLFDTLRPAEIGVSLNDSCLMLPLKSVSGLLLAGESGIHRFSPDLPVCHACQTHECTRRMASLRSGGPRG